jgi:D-glycero-alpha-D-manno-heptose-7-phosphate kinase
MFRSRAPLRLGLAGGGTDVSPYSDDFGGAILNATINLHSYAVINERSDGKIVFRAEDRNESFETEATEEIAIDGLLDLHKGVYNRLVKQFVKKPLSFELTTYSDAPAGSGLGTSSTMVVAILGAFVEWLKLPLGEYDIAKLAYEIEREDLAMAGGKQDQYAATFGGVNFMEFSANNKVIVNPLRIRKEVMYELENNLVLYNTATSRVSAEIIKSQTENIKQNKASSIEAMDKLKEQAFMMKEVMLKGKLDGIGEILDFGWKFKKNLAEAVTNPQIDEIYDAAKKAGALGGKISGAGGGGFFFFYCPNNARYAVISELNKFGGKVRKYHFTNEGLTTWNTLNF